MTLLASLGGWVWLGPATALTWAGSVLGLMGLNRVIWSWIEREPQPTPGMERALAASTFLYAAVYCVLPATLIIDGQGASPLVGGLAMIVAIALSATSEMVISRRVGGSAMVALFLASVVMLSIRTAGEPWPDVIFAALATVAVFVCVLQFAVQRVQADRVMRGALAEAQAANIAKSVFLATMSHEIRTPLNGVLGMAQAMALGTLCPEQRERLAIIHDSGDALKTILNDVLDLSKIEAGRLEIENLPFDLEPTLRTALAPFEPLVAEKALTLSLDITPTALGVYRGDPVRLRQVIGNLLSNAIKFTATGAVTIAATRIDGVLSIAVKDTGQGIPADQIQHMFSPFAQLDASTTRRHGGTGLGLAICRELCRLMEGDITVDGRPGEGSIFTVSLKLDWLGPTPTEAGATARDEEGGLDVSSLKVLAAEDNRINQIVLKTLLGQAGLVPHLVENGAEAIEAWASAEWDLILMDIHMPVMDGVAAVREFRSREAAGSLRRTPVIALTANAMTHQVQELLAAGMDAHVAKPIDVASLFAAMEDVLSEAGKTAPVSAVA